MSDPAQPSDPRALSFRSLSGVGDKLGPTKSKRNLHDPEQYATNILSFSKLTSSRSRYAGGYFGSFAAYLQRPYETRAPDLGASNSSLKQDPAFNFITLYDFDPESPDRVQHFNAVEKFEEKARSLKESPGHLVFLRGCPSPEWILSIGAMYKVDPEVFRRHLNLGSGPRDYYSLPPLPSTSTSSLSLLLSTIGISAFAEESKKDTSQEILENSRSESRHWLRLYQERLRTLSDVHVGESIVRDCSIHDLHTFSFEQGMSVYVTTREKGWVALVWSDVASGLHTGHASWLTSPLPSEPWKISTLDTVQPKPGVVLRNPAKLCFRDTSIQLRPENVSQSGRHLHLDYGVDLDRNHAAKDPFYALHELVVFATFSENQFLNMLESKVSEELDVSVLIRQKNPTISNLLYDEQILERHIHWLEGILHFLQSDDVSNWPHAELKADERSRTTSVKTNLIRDFSHLLSRSVALSEKCNKGMQVVMNNAMIQESREAIAQAEGVAKLTRLAFFFIPLSFTASFFGMNFSQFGQGHLGIWIWFVASLPVFLFSLLLMKYDINLKALVWGYEHTCI